MIREFKIYELICPLSKQMKYIGKTIFDLKTRLNGHLSDRNKCHKAHWIKSLKAQKLSPEIKLIKICKDEKRCNYAETFYIKLYGRRDLGLGGLLNHTNGGDGSVGLKHTEATKEKLRNRIWKRPPLTEEQRQKISLFFKTFIKTEEHKRKIAISHIGLKPSETTRKKLSESKKGQVAWNKGLTGFVKSEATIQKMKDSLKGRKLSEEHKIKIGQRHLGKIISHEMRERISKARLGQRVSEETKIKISQKYKPKKHTAESKEKIRQKALGRKSWKKGLSVPCQTNYKIMKNILIIFTSHLLKIRNRSAENFLMVA